MGWALGKAPVETDQKVCWAAAAGMAKAAIAATSKRIERHLRMLKLYHAARPFAFESRLVSGAAVSWCRFGEAESRRHRPWSRDTHRKFA